MRYLRVVIVTMVIGLAVGCSPKDAPQLHDPTRVVRFTGVKFTDNTCKGCSDDVTLHFEDARTHEKFDVNNDYGTPYEAIDLITMLDWLDKGRCYTDPLSSTDHKEVSCG